MINVSADHKVTATLTDGTVTLAQLHADVQAAIGKAHTHANKAVLDGITAEKVTDWDSKAPGEHTHDITDLTQAAGYVVFNCGSASVNI